MKKHLIIILLLLSGCAATPPQPINIAEQQKPTESHKDAITARPDTEPKPLTPKGSIDDVSLQEIKISFVGDLMLGSRVKDAIYKNGCDRSFSGTKKALESSDAIIINLETAVTTGGKKFNKQRTFHADPTHLDCLTDRHPNVIANLANNHIGDYGPSGVQDTLDHLKTVWIDFFWAGKNQKEAYKLFTFTQQKTKIWLIWQTCIQPPAFRAQPDKAGNAQRDKEKLLSNIKEAKDQNIDVLIFNGHCGKEYRDTPHQLQTDMYHFAIDNGVDLVIGHHPHRYQGIEMYKGNAIFYSLGNFISDIFRWHRTQEGIIVTVTITDKKVTQAEIIPVDIEGFGKTTLASNQQKKRIRKELYQLGRDASVMRPPFQDTPTLLSGKILFDTKKTN